MEGLFKFGSADFSNKIKTGSYDITPNARQDLDSYRDADGILRRTALSHTATIVEFDTIILDEEDMRVLMHAIVLNYINFNERDAECTYYDPETGQMKTGHFYLDSNLKFGLLRIENGRKIYKETHFKFVEY